jgi:ADP-heptose:LPS heptosyltransferase
MDDSPTFEPRRILIIRRRAMGDIMVSLAVPAALKARWPQARIDMVVDRGLDAVAQGHLFLDDLVVYDARKVRAAGPIAQARLTISWLRQLRRKHYDIVIDLMSTPQTALWTYFTGAAMRVGRALRGRAWAYNRIVRPIEKRFAGEMFLDWVRAIGVDPGTWFPVAVPAAARHTVAANLDLDDRLGIGRPRVILNPGATWSAKAWPVRHFATLAQGIFEQLGTPALVAWGPGEEALRDTVVELAQGAALALPETDLPTLAAYLGASDLLVTTCAGPKHLAVAQGTPTLTLFGSTDPAGWQPPGAMHRWLVNDVPCRPCNLTECPVSGHPCLDDLTPAKVLVTVLEMVRSRTDTD